MRIVLDTNVLLSGLLWRGPAHTILERVQRGKQKTAPLLDAATLAGYARRAIGGDGGVGAKNRIDDFTLVV